MTYKDQITSINVNIVHHNELRLIISIRIKIGIGELEKRGREEKKNIFKKKKETTCRMYNIYP